MNDELNHWQPSCEEICPIDYTSFNGKDHELCCEHIDDNNSLDEGDVDALYESCLDTGD